MIVKNVVDGGKAFRVPAHLSLGQHVIDCLKENSINDSVALVNGDNGEETTFSQILQGTVDAAIGLRKLGLKKGDTVALCGENMIKYLTAALGAVCCGATITPINPMYPKDEILHAFSLSRPRFILASRASLKVHLNLLKSFSKIEKIIQLDGVTPVDPRVLVFNKVAIPGGDVRSFEPTPVHGHSDNAFILYSSGTTGLPKGVMLTHINYLYSVNGDNGEETTFSQILQGTVDAAIGLRKLGLKKGDTVALCGENMIKYLTAALGAVCCGATITPINPMYPKDEILHAFSLSRPRFILASRASLKVHLNLLKSFSKIEKIIQLDGVTPVDPRVLVFNKVAIPGGDVRSFEPTPVHGHSDNAFILYSSGTTGLPKGVMLTHINYLYSVMLFESQNLPKSLLCIVPWYHAYGLMTIINLLILKKLVVFFSGLFNPPKYLQAIQDYKIGVLVVVPPIVVYLAKAPLVEQYDLSSIKMVWCGAAPLSSDTIEAALKRMPECMGIFQGYGMTETSLAVTKATPGEDVASKPGSCGYPIPGVQLKVVDIRTRKKLGPNQNGEVCIRGPIIMKGYIDNEAATREIMDEEGYLKTGDIGYYDEDGCLFLVDRLREFIKYKGFEVAPAEVESVILQHSGVAECGVVGDPDDKAGELATAFVVPKPGESGDRLTEKELLDFTEARLSTSARLHGGVIIVDEIPKTHSGKILRRLLKEKLLERKKLTKQ